MNKLSRLIEISSNLITWIVLSRDAEKATGKIAILIISLAQFPIRKRRRAVGGIDYVSYPNFLEVQNIFGSFPTTKNCNNYSKLLAKN